MCNSEKFEYNGLNQLVGYEGLAGSYNGKMGLSAKYKYMPNGYRLSKDVNGVTTKFLWDGDEISAELNSANAITDKYYRGANLISDSSDNYYASDVHGNIIETYDINGDYPNKWYFYNAFGGNDYFDDSDTINGTYNSWGYCGQYYDFETGNYYMRARYYNTDTGRFTTEDPIKNGFNWYAYCGNNPVNYADRNGLYYIKEEVTFSPDMDPRNPDYCKPTGRYYVVPETVLSAARSVALSALPYGDFWNFAYENMTTIVGGNSVVQFDKLIFSTVNNITGEAIKKLDIPFIDKLSKITGGISLFSNIKTKTNIIDLDNVSLDFWDNANVSRYSYSKDALEISMKKSYEFININEKYFLTNTVFGTPVYYLDKMIANSSNPLNKINSLCDMFIKKGATSQKAKEFGDFLNQYDTRLDFYQNLYNNYVFSL